MSKIEPEFLKKVVQWLSLADEDLNLASHALGLGAQSPYRLIAYHAQQCAEKCLKVFWFIIMWISHTLIISGG